MPQSLPKISPNSFVTLFLLICSLPSSLTNQIIIPLTYTQDPVSHTKYPIRLSFDSSSTTTPTGSNLLPLFNYNKNASVQQVTIGLKYPSTFLSALEQTFNIEPRQIQFGMEQYIQLIINGNNFVQSRDVFVNDELYVMKAVYNFGDPLVKADQRCFLQDGEKVELDQLLVLQILNTMPKRNNIQYTQNIKNKTIDLEGSLENFPKISFTLGKSIFQVEIKGKSINYIPRSNSSDSVNKIGYKAFRKFSKFQIGEGVITFKRTSQLYQLYLFLGYFFVFTLTFIIISRTKLQESMKFVRSVIGWAVFHQRDARVRVLRTQLQ